MIVIPVVLKNLLGEADESTASQLAIRFAYHVVERISEPARSSVQEYLSEAENILETGHGHEALRNTQSAVRQLSWDADSFAEGKAIALAINATYCGLQRRMEEAGLSPKQRYQPSAADIAQDAQDIARKLAEESGEQNPSIHAYEESRWQLMELIQCLPNLRSDHAGG